MERIRPKKKLTIDVDAETGTADDKLPGTAQDWRKAAQALLREPRDRPPADFTPYSDPVHVQIKPQGGNVLIYREKAHADGTAARAYYAGTLLVGMATLSPGMITFKYHHLSRGDTVDRYETETALHKALRLMLQDAGA